MACIAAPDDRDSRSSASTAGMSSGNAADRRAAANLVTNCFIVPSAATPSRLLYREGDYERGCQIEGRHECWLGEPPMDDFQSHSVELPVQ